MTTCQIINGSALAALKHLPDESIQCVVTSPPYWSLRDYRTAGQIGLEATPEAYIRRLVRIFSTIRRKLTKTGTIWVNMGDTYASEGGSGWKGKAGDRADRWFTAYRDAVGMRAVTRRPPAGIKPKDLVGLPWMLAFALRADGWYLRQDIIWAKTTPMPESVKDRCTKAHEYIFMLSKSKRYFFDSKAIAEPSAVGLIPENDRPYDYRAQHRPYGWSFDDGRHSTIDAHQPENHAKTAHGKWSNQHPDATARQMSDNVARARSKGGNHDNPLGTMRNRRDVWTITSEAFPGAHFATFPTEIPRLCILAGTRPGDTVLDPFGGSGTTGQVAQELGRHAILIEINRAYCEMARARTAQTGMILESGRAEVREAAPLFPEPSEQEQPQTQSATA